MRQVLITFSSNICIHTIDGIIKDDSFLGGDIEFSCSGCEEIGYDLFFYNSRECEGFSINSLPVDFKAFLESLPFRKF